MSIEESEPLMKSEDKSLSADYTSLLGGKKPPKYTQTTVIGEVSVTWTKYLAKVLSVSSLSILGKNVRWLVNKCRLSR